MTNYTVTNNPVAHSVGNSATIRAEFPLIATAITSKADRAGQVYTGTHDHTGAVDLVATQAAGDNTTKAASTAHVFAERTNAATLTNKTLTTPVIKSPTGLVKADVGLGNVDNTTDAGKPISTATQTALDLKAPIASPTFTGVVTIPSGASIAGFAPLASPTFTGVVTVPAPSNATDATTKTYVDTQITNSLSGGILWVSGTTYPSGFLVYSPITFGTYRSTNALTSNTDPSIDSSNWASIGGGGGSDIANLFLGII